jgi:membrane associated rhomboid family serine protease
MYEVTKNRRSAVWSLLGVMLLALTVTRIGVVWFESHIFERYLSLSIAGLREGNLWQLMTYPFMHDGIWHLFLNAVVLFFMGTLIEQRYGNSRLLVIFFISGLIGGIVWSVVNFGEPFHRLCGASAGCLGIFSYFCFFCEDRPATFLLFFVIPVKLRPRILLAVVGGLEAFCFFTQELAGSRVAHSAHLGGILGGCLCYYFYHCRGKLADIFRKKLIRKSQADAIQEDNYKLYITSHSARRSEVDRILDKINEHGFKSLTEGERKTLNAAKHLMHR